MVADSAMLHSITVLLKFAHAHTILKNHVELAFMKLAVDQYWLVVYSCRFLNLSLCNKKSSRDVQADEIKVAPYLKMPYHHAKCHILNIKWTICQLCRWATAERRRPCVLTDNEIHRNAARIKLEIYNPTIIKFQISPLRVLCFFCVQCCRMIFDRMIIYLLDKQK